MKVSKISQRDHSELPSPETDTPIHETTDPRDMKAIEKKADEW